MSIYDHSAGTSSRQISYVDPTERAGYRPGWIWLPLAALLLLTILVIGVGMVYSGNYARQRAYDNGARMEYLYNDVTVSYPDDPATRYYRIGTEEDELPIRPLVRPEEAPPLANDGF